MFTGIITHTGKIEKKSSASLEIRTPHDMWKKLSKGVSIAVNGICFTVIDKKEHDVFEIQYMPETEKKTNIRFLKPGNMVNLELPATPHSFLAGHIVQGHVDTTGKILNIEERGNSRIFTFQFDSTFAKYIVEKGSIAVNGISLTVIDAEKDFFTVGIIPHTWNNTMFSTAKKGDIVNIEIDIIAKHVEKLLKTYDKNTR